MVSGLGSVRHLFHREREREQKIRTVSVVSGAHRDKDGYIWITGRIDDLVNVSGHLLSTAEVESALIEHKAVAEAASVSHPHSIKGECIYCFVTLKQVLQLARVVPGFPQGKGDPDWGRILLKTTHRADEKKRRQCVCGWGRGCIVVFESGTGVSSESTKQWAEQSTQKPS